MWYLIGLIITFCAICIFMGYELARDPDCQEYFKGADCDIIGGFVTLGVVMCIMWPIVMLIFIFGVIPYCYFKEQKNDNR